MATKPMISKDKNGIGKSENFTAFNASLILKYNRMRDENNFRLVTEKC
jgi:hypothetical protein